MTTLAPVAIHPVTSVAEATEILSELGDGAVVYAGGTELLLLMKLGFAAYGHLVDVKPIAELSGVSVVEGHLRIGGAVTHRAIERSPLVVAGWPALRQMERSLANIRVRNVGSLGGYLAFADPHSDPVALALRDPTDQAVTGKAAEIVGHPGARVLAEREAGGARRRVAGAGHWKSPRGGD